MRLFIAVELPTVVQEAAARVSHALRQRVSNLAPTAQLTWIPPERMHLTLRFLGEVNETQANALADVMATPLEEPAFDLSLGLPGAFSERRAPRVLWLGIDQGEAALIRLEQEVSARLVSFGFAREKRPYRPHLTLARVRDPRQLRGIALFAETRERSADAGTVDAITLFHSRLSPRGPTYTPLRRTPLRQ